MGKGRKGGPPPKPAKKKARAGQLILLAVVIASFVGAYVLWNQGAGSEGASTSGPLDPLSGMGKSDRLILPASPRSPRPITLDPALFPDPEVKRSYEVAQETPEPLEHVACYCGCFNTSGHRNNLDCFHDGHGST